MFKCYPKVINSSSGKLKEITTVRCLKPFMYLWLKIKTKQNRQEGTSATSLQSYYSYLRDEPMCDYI